MADPTLGRSVASPETQLRALKADEHYGAVLSSGTDKELLQAQREVWVAIGELRKVVKRYGR